MHSDFTLALLRWFQANGRELPWRQTRDPYAIWLSEIILQQTRVQQGRDYWERFMQRWPTVEQLSQATEDEVLRLWQGLGYYSRARNLLAAARQVVAMGGFPQTLDGLRSLKGVGDYTAAAIGSFAFGLPAAVVDGNVYRVLARHFGIATPINSTAGKHEFAALAQALLPRDRAADYNQAIMDFGALECTPKRPDCHTCPLCESCMALREGKTDSLPVKMRKLTVKTRRLVYIYIRCNGRVAIRQRGAGDIWQGLWEPLLAYDSTDDAQGEGARMDLWSVKGEGWSEDSRLILLRKDVKHVLTHRILLADFYLLETDRQPALPPDYRWIAETDLARYAVPRLVELLLEAATAQAGR